MTIQIPTFDFIAILPQLILIGAALIVLITDALPSPRPPNPPKLGGRGAAVLRSFAPLTIIALLAALAASAWLAQGAPRPLQTTGSGPIAIADSVALTANLIILTAGILATLLAHNYIARISASPGEFHALLLLACAGLTAMSASLSLMTIFLSLEIFSLSLYILTGFNLQQPRSAEAAMKYFLLGAFASAFLLYGIALMYAAVQTTDLTQMARTLALSSDSSPMAPLLPVGVGLLLVGFGFKLALVPFHMWSPDAYQGAPTPVTAFMSVATKTAVLAALLRILAALQVIEQPWLLILAILALVTMTLGNLAALRQTSLKRLLAYSSIAHAGYLIVGLIANSAASASAVLYYLLAYAFMNIGAFAVAQTLENSVEMDIEISALDGLGRRRPLLAAALAIFMLSLAGIPPLAGFFAKLYVFKAAVEAGWAWLVIAAVLNSALSAYYYLRIIVAMYLGSETASGPIRHPIAWQLALGIASLGALLLGLVPAPWGALLRTAVYALGGG